MSKSSMGYPSRRIMKWYTKPTNHPNNTADVFDSRLLDLLDWLDKLIENNNSKQTESNK